jgi:quinol monooxygenase YgiN
MAADVVEPGRIVFHERYRDLDALAAHRDSDHYRRFLRSVRDIEIIEGPTLMSYFDGQPCDIGPSSLAR